jgi:hypothetical protein
MDDDTILFPDRFLAALDPAVRPHSLPLAGQHSSRMLPLRKKHKP